MGTLSLQSLCPYLTLSGGRLSLPADMSSDVDRGVRCDRPEWLNGQQATPTNMGGDGTIGFGETHQQQHSLRYHYQRCQAAAQDRSKDEFESTPGKAYPRVHLSVIATHLLYIYLVRVIVCVPSKPLSRS